MNSGNAESPSRDLKAYAVHDNYEGYGAVVFATCGIAARHKGANELDIAFEDVETCRRAPEFDKYAPGLVPPLTLIEHGWRFECTNCGRRVSNNMADDLEADGLNPADFVPRPDGNRGVFCGESCECAHHMERRNKAEAHDALIEVFEAKFPGAMLIGTHVYEGPRLLPPDGRGITYAVYFTFPGSPRSVIWQFGSDTVELDERDADAYRAWRASHAC